MYRHFPDTASDPATSAKPSVCIVTSEVVGPFKNGGIGSSMTGLAKTLAQAGFPVTILYTAGIWQSDADLHTWKVRYAGIGIDLEWLTRDDIARLGGLLTDCGYVVPYAVYTYLRGRRFDVIHFNDCMGEGFYCLAMKRQGQGFSNTLLCLAHHGPSQWVYEINRTVPDQPIHLAFSYAERLSTRCADLLWSPSRYMLEWSEANGFVHPEQTFIQPYVVPEAGLFENAEAPVDVVGLPSSSTQIEEIVFFGRLEERKGIRLFCESVSQLGDVLAAKKIKVTFLGKSAQVGTTDALVFLREKAAGWPFVWQALTTLGQQEALVYIRECRALVVMASPADNSPCTVYEALALGIPFVAARVGGIPELITPEDHEHVLFDYSAQALVSKLRQAIESGHAAALPSQPQVQARRNWIEMHRHWREWLPSPPPSSNPALQSVCAVVDHTGKDNLELTLSALSRIPEIERIVVINRSGTGLKTLRAVKFLEPSTDCRDALMVELKSGAPAVLLLRSGMILEADGLRRLLSALQQSSADGLVPAVFAKRGKSTILMPPLGGGVAFCFYFGAMPHGCCVMKSSALTAAIAEHALPVETEFFGICDFAVTGGLALWPHAEPVATHPTYEYRAPPLAAAERVLAYALSDAERYYIAGYGYATARLKRPQAFRWRLGLHLSRLGLGWFVMLARNVLPKRISAVLLDWFAGGA